MVPVVCCAAAGVPAAVTRHANASAVASVFMNLEPPFYRDKLSVTADKATAGPLNGWAGSVLVTRDRLFVPADRHWSTVTETDPNGCTREDGTVDNARQKWFREKSECGVNSGLQGSDPKVPSSERSLNLSDYYLISTLRSTAEPPLAVVRSGEAVEATRPLRARRLRAVPAARMRLRDRSALDRRCGSSVSARCR